MIRDLDTEIPFITMNPDNIQKYNINPVNSNYIFLFDIDDTLYKASEEMHNLEMEKWYSAYKHFKLEVPCALDFNTLLDSKPLYSEAFYYHFNKTPYEVEKVKGFLDYSKFVKRNEDLKLCLKNIKHRKWCFTNGMKCRAEPILKCLDLLDTFEGVICMDNKCPSNLVLGKPYKQVYYFVEELLKIQDKSKVYFFDDSIVNINIGKKMGWNSFLIEKKDNIINVLNDVMDKIADEMER
ncbi:hypothetical protein NCER_102029 [Vairimorpha ceranae BRL01]|uniref:Pyrimidine 5-nucleotidase n=2 Tax=Vairimorpha ceranae TaxID=40302 RepID=C4VB90_VAIC1|nr:pyrimidine 5 -nucleotidase [Vairimorpha ceranae]EEQ81513.1 hypothetical protein NCER_102029 [Vairimorpha ceranae BRL01]KAF5141414.1 hypothetical protein G9O61_00g004130 [Vairimorpha ceranae]KKO74651.1 pyrimidine 5 -nucleotidase [Vairimorpha ceranae]